MQQKNTKIVCTLGPSTDSVTEITALAKAGMNVARLNFSHGTYKHHAMLIKNIRKVEKILNTKIGILQDLQGPKIRIGQIEEPGIKVKKGQTYILSASQKQQEGKIIPINYKNLTKDVKKGHRILINDGLIETKVTKVSKKDNSAEIKITYGGLITTGRGVNFPDSNLSAETITPKDQKDLKFGLKHGVDFVALSFVKSQNCILALHKLLKRHRKKVQIIAKVERHEAVKNLKGIIENADGIMVARGDLGTDIPAERVPIVQKQIISLANRYGKPVITATQVLQSMITNSRATRAEISDAANAVFDHTDAIMLSNETAVGKYASKAARTLKDVSTTVESELRKNNTLLEHTPNQHLSQLNATCLNACELAIKTKASAIIIYTLDGYTAKQIAKYRLYTPMITLTPDKHFLKHSTLVWGLNQVFFKKLPKSSDKKIEQIKKFLTKNRLVKKGQKIVIVGNTSKKDNFINTLCV